MIKTTKKPKTTSAKATPCKPNVFERATPAVKPVAAAPVVATPKAMSPKTNGPSHISLELVKPGAKTVCVAGSFNEWKPEKTPLVPKGNGRWVGDLAVKPGRHEYLFVVDGQWVPDPNAKETVANPFGGQNSVLIVSE